jgi:hypothetical protein
MLDGIIVIGAKNYILFTVHGAAGQGDAIAADGQESRHDRERVSQNVELSIGEKLDHGVGRRAAVDNDAYTVGNQFHGRLGDGAFLTDADTLTQFKGNADEARFVSRRECFGTAANTPQLSFVGQRIDIASHGRLRGAEDIH